MNAQQNGRVHCTLLSATLLIVPLLCGTTWATDYTYSDDFSTEKVMADSYEHSTILMQPPGVSLEAYLLLGEHEGGNRALGFFNGYLVGADAILAYRFPLGEPIGELGSGTLAFNVSQDPLNSMFLEFSEDGASWQQLAAVVDPGPNTFDLPLSGFSSRVHIRFVGTGTWVDDLSVELTAGPTSIQSLHWGRIKNLYAR